MDQIGYFSPSLETVEGTPAEEPRAKVVFLRTDGRPVSTSSNLQFPPAHRFALPAFPLEHFLRCEISCERFQPTVSEFFVLTDGKEKSTTAKVVRTPEAWTGKFTSWSSLGDRFAPLKRILAESKDVKLKHGPPLGSIAEAGYDQMEGEEAILAKLALLNQFAVLNDGVEPIEGRRAWFTFVQKFVVIDQERFVALVDPELYKIVDSIRTDLRRFNSFFLGDTSLHHDNIPSRYSISDIISVKGRYEQGNIQFTVAKAKDQAGADCTILDCDMDEHSNVILHLGDVFRHCFTGGTHPVEIHEFIKSRAPQTDLGYVLMPKAAIAQVGG